MPARLGVRPVLILSPVADVPHRTEPANEGLSLIIAAHVFAVKLDMMRPECAANTGDKMRKR